MTTPPADSHAQVAWWLPILYTAFGAILGFVFTRLRDWLDERTMQKRFFAAVRAELAALNEHLKGTLRDATEYKARLNRGQRELLHLVVTFQRGIYDSQISKLRDVSDPLVIEVIQFYDKLSNLERVKAGFASVSFELTSLSDAQADIQREGPLVSQYRAALAEIIRRINDLLPMLPTLIAKLERP